MTEEQIDPIVATQLTDFEVSDFWFEPLKPYDPPVQDWADRHWLLLLGVALIGFWFAVIYIVSLYRHH